MEDSKLLVYIVLAAIYFIVKIVRSKKPAKEEQEQDQTVSEKPTGPTFEELFEELTRQKNKGSSTPSQNTDPKRSAEQEVVPEPVRPTYSSKSTYEPVVERHESTTAEIVAKDEELDNDIENIRKTNDPITIVRDKPIYQRSLKYSIKEEVDDQVGSDVMDLLSDSHGAKRAFVLAEIFQRKY